MNYLLLDLETTTKTSFKRKANPFDKDNFVVIYGMKSKTRPFTYSDYRSKDWMDYPDTFDIFDCLFEELLYEKIDIIVGFNIKFDLLYFWDKWWFQEWLQEGGKIWDCQLSQYMLSAQTWLYPSLNQCALHYGGTVKDDRVKALWEAGVDTPDIPKEMLLDYLQDDILNTEKVFLGQLKDLENNTKLKRLVELQMDALLATTEMEYNGMKVDKNILENSCIENQECLIELETRIRRLLFPNTNNVWFNLNSNDHLSAAMFGGCVYVESRQPQLDEAGQPKIFKSGINIGKQRMCIIKEEKQLTGFLKPKAKWATKKDGVYSTASDVLEDISKLSGKAGRLARMLLDYRTINKLIGTYYEPLKDLRQEGGLVHPKLNHCATVTGRLSSNDPNMQNIPRPVTGQKLNVKQVFVSRFENGKIVDVDFSGLEVVAAAFLSQDRQMIKDLEDKIDPHRIRAATIFKKDVSNVTDDERQLAKAASFALLYGAEEYSIGMNQFNGNTETARWFITAYYARYPELQQWHDKLIQHVELNAIKGDHKTLLGRDAKHFIASSCTGRKYCFIEQDAKPRDREQGKTTYFKPTFIKNYPVQGFATADLVLIMLGKLFRKLIHHRDKCLLINTVHDSVLIDCKPEYLTKIVKGTIITLEDVKSTLKQEFNLDFNVPIKVEAKAGVSWGELEKL